MPGQKSSKSFGKKKPASRFVKLFRLFWSLVNRGMTIGTPDVVTAITMVRNGELDKFIALYEERDYQGQLRQAHSG